MRDIDLLNQVECPEVTSDPWHAVTVRRNALTRSLESKISDFGRTTSQSMEKVIPFLPSSNEEDASSNRKDRVKDVPAEARAEVRSILSDVLDYFRNCMEIADRLGLMDDDEVSFGLAQDGELFQTISQEVHEDSAEWTTRMLITFALGMFGTDCSARVHLLYEEDIHTYLLNSLDRDTGARKPGTSHSRKNKYVL